MPFRNRLPTAFPMLLLLMGLFLAPSPEAAAADAPAVGAPTSTSSSPAPTTTSTSTSIPTPTSATAPGLNQKAVHDEYMNGNFETVVARIEDFRKKNPAHSREDSLFIARHLGVVLSADPRTAQAGKYWMHRLLLLSPEADLSGMYASEAIERVFADMKREEGRRAGHTGGRGGRKWLWIGAGGAAVAAGLAVWFAVSPGEESPERIVVPVDL